MQKTRRTVLIGLILLIALLHLPLEAAEKPSVSARSAVLMDRDSGRVLWKKNEHRRRPIASTTKIMTALLALERGAEGERVKVSGAAAATEGSSIWLEKGEKKELGELIYGLMLCSGNDAAAAIAEHIGGSEKKFVALMNERARALGAENTNYANPHGLPAKNHYSTAYDLALITCEALKNERFREIISTPARTISWPGQPWDRLLVNQNRLLELYPGADGVKTGWTEKAGRCFVGSATKQRWQLVAVVLKSSEIWEDSAALLDYGFQRYRHQKLFSKNQVLCTAEVMEGRERAEIAVCKAYHYPLLPSEQKRLNYRIRLHDSIRAPLTQGEKLGEVEVYLQKELICCVDLCALRPVLRKEYSDYLHDLFILMLQEGW